MGFEPALPLFLISGEEKASSVACLEWSLRGLWCEKPVSVGR